MDLEGEFAPSIAALLTSSEAFQEIYRLPLSEFFEERYETRSKSSKAGKTQFLERRIWSRGSGLASQNARRLLFSICVAHAMFVCGEVHGVTVLALDITRYESAARPALPKLFENPQEDLQSSRPKTNS